MSVPFLSLKVRVIVVKLAFFIAANNNLKPSQFIELLLLSAIWGGSFLFMRIAVPETGSPALAALRMTIAGLILFPFFWHYSRKRDTSPFSQHADNKTVTKHVWLVAVVNSAIPMLLFAFAASNLDAGFASILNATTPLWGALIGALFFTTKLSKSAIAGLMLGFFGVVVLSWDKLNMDASGQFMAVLAIVLATCFYGIGTNYAKRNLIGVKPMFIASASLFWGSVFMLPLLLYTLPDFINISLKAWLATIALGSVATGFAYVFFYRIVDHSGPTKAMMVTYLIPVFGVMFGNIFLNEQITANMFYGAALILLGVALTTGVLRKRS